MTRIKDSNDETDSSEILHEEDGDEENEHDTELHQVSPASDPEPDNMDVPCMRTSDTHGLNAFEDPRHEGRSCLNCGTQNSLIYRMGPNGELLCNQCGLYFRLYGVNRPLDLYYRRRLRRRRLPDVHGILPDETTEDQEPPEHVQSTISSDQDINNQESDDSENNSK
ncbi:Transcriptional regulatory protein GAT1 [Thelohanellus kitauei]|uniref:Transcriptional regulatory protein GAT1 n=1 Tax=Thelohanellus kitauei TaxID=669202 RepID=A0A0C2NB53_THEKT|nr:Transcriptional regulatory protein GAT1 [Thelohanellus kitauei]